VGVYDGFLGQKLALNLGVSGVIAVARGHVPDGPDRDFNLGSAMRAEDGSIQTMVSSWWLSSGVASPQASTALLCVPRSVRPRHGSRPS